MFNRVLSRSFFFKRGPQTDLGGGPPKENTSEQDTKLQRLLSDGMEERALDSMPEIVCAMFLLAVSTMLITSSDCSSIGGAN